MNKERKKVCRLTFIKVNFWSSCKAGDFFICGAIAAPCTRRNDDCDLIDKFVSFSNEKCSLVQQVRQQVTHRMLFTTNIGNVQFGNKTSFQ